MIRSAAALLLLVLSTGCGSPGAAADGPSGDDLGGPGADLLMTGGPDMAACANTPASCGVGGVCMECPHPPGSNATCTDGACGFTCADGKTMCAQECTDVAFDSHNCGSCAHDCLGADCSDGACLANVIGEVLQCVAVTIQNYNVYFTDVGDGTIYGLSLINGGGAMPLATKQGEPTGVAANGTHVFWTDFAGGYVMSKPLMNGGPMTIAGGQAGPHDLAIDAQSVYWVNSGDGTVMKAPIDGGDAEVLASGQNMPFRIALDATSVYWTNQGDGTVMKVPVGGGVKPTLLADAQAQPNGIAVDATSVYWVNGADGTVRKVPIGGGMQPTTLAMGQSTPHSIAVDPSGVYWTNYADGMMGSVARIPPNGKAPVVIAMPIPPTAPTGIALEPTSVVFVDKVSGIIWRVAK